MNESKEVILTGLDGSNPLAFMAALGTLLTLNHILPHVKLRWINHSNSWRPVLSGSEFDSEKIAEAIASALSNTSNIPFEIDKKMPFSNSKLKREMRSAAINCRVRRTADILAAYGCSIGASDENFVDSKFRMVRSGDSAGQGFPHYALTIRNNVNFELIRKSLFGVWDYSDDCFSLRWDPIEDSQYALRWNDPSKSQKRTLIGANCLAIESLQLFPSVPSVSNLCTTGFHRHNREDYFTWPIWSASLNTEVIRSLLSIPDIHCPKPNMSILQQWGISQIFRSRRYAPNQYYRNFTPSVSIG